MITCRRFLMQPGNPPQVKATQEGLLHASPTF